MRLEIPTVVFLAFDEVGIVDVCGPLTVFQRANRFLQLERKEGYHCQVASIDGGAVPTWEGIDISTIPITDVAHPAHTIIAPGGTPQTTLADGRLVSWLVRYAPAASRVCSVCSGAYLLAEAGLLNGRRAVTHWLECDNLQARYPRVEVERDAIFVRDGPIWSSAGVTAGIDLALALVEHDQGRDLAMRIARELVVFLKRPGGQSQFSAMLESQAADREAFADLHEWILRRLDDPSLTVEVLATQAGMSPRNFARVYRVKTGRTPAKAIELFRLEAARRLLEDTDERVDAIARRTGFNDEEPMRITFHRNLKVSPTDYRERFGRGSRRDAAPDEDE